MALEGEALGHSRDLCGRSAVVMRGDLCAPERPHLYPPLSSPLGTGGGHWACKSATCATKTISSVIPSGAGLGTDLPSSCSMDSRRTRTCGSVWSRCSSTFLFLRKEKGFHWDMMSTMVESRGNPELWPKSS